MYNQIDANKQKTGFLIFLFIIFVIGLGWFLSYFLNRFWIMPVAIFIALFQAFLSYYAADTIALLSSGAKPIKKRDASELYRVTENLCLAGGIPVPKIYIIQTPAMNAFATGRDPKNASLAVTAGLLLKLNKTELEGVVSHELSHIKNYDIRLMMVVIVLVGVVTLISDLFLRSLWFSGDDNGGGQARLIGMIIGICLMILSPLFAMLLQLSISRKREFLADASGALLTRYPEGLADALEKISQDKVPMPTANNATAHLFIENPFLDQQGEHRSWLSKLFDTHPPVEERIKKLRTMIKQN